MALEKASLADQRPAKYSICLRPLRLLNRSISLAVSTRLAKPSCRVTALSIEANSSMSIPCPTIILIKRS